MLVEKYFYTANNWSLTSFVATDFFGNIEIYNFQCQRSYVIIRAREEWERERIYIYANRIEEISAILSSILTI